MSVNDVTGAETHVCKTNQKTSVLSVGAGLIPGNPGLLGLYTAFLAPPLLPPGFIPPASSSPPCPPAHKALSPSQPQSHKLL